MEQYAQRLVDVFDQARRVLTPTGTGWLNVGDSYFGGGKLAYDTAGQMPVTRSLPGSRAGSPLPAENLIGVPWGCCATRWSGRRQTITAKAQCHEAMLQARSGADQGPKSRPAADADVNVLF